MDPTNFGDFAILVNKTSPFERANGDLNVMMIIHPGMGLRNYQNWIHPTSAKRMGFSQNQLSAQPEIIEVCEEALTSWCAFKNYPECALMFSVTGLTRGSTSFFRMKVFNGTNKLTPGVPIANSL